MTSSSPRQQQESVEMKKLASVIPLRPAARENGITGKKNSKGKKEIETPLIYSKPIFRTRKYDLL